MIIYDTGVSRDDIFKGVFSLNDNFVTTPYGDSFSAIADVEKSVASGILDVLNGQGGASKRSLSDSHDKEPYRRGSAQKRYERWLKDVSSRGLEDKAWSESTENLTLGYVTKDVRIFSSSDLRHIIRYLKKIDFRLLQRLVPESATTLYINPYQHITIPITLRPVYYSKTPVTKLLMLSSSTLSYPTSSVH